MFLFIFVKGEKCCAHIYGVFPYILLKIVVPLDDQLKDLITSTLTNILLKTYPNLEDPLVELKEIVARLDCRINKR